MTQKHVGASLAIFLFVSFVLIFFGSALVKAEMKTAGVIISVASSAFVYLAPAWAAKMRRHKNFAPIFILNLFFGWTIIAWIACLAWAFSSNVSIINPPPQRS